MAHKIYKEFIHDLVDNSISINNYSSKRSKLLIILGCLGDFDSFEYVQNLMKLIRKLEEKGIEIIIYAIGNHRSKLRFCRYNKLPEKYLNILKDDMIHKRLDLESGLRIPISSYLNLILMCFGIGSPGTMKEVLRGYTGDKNSNNIFNNGYLSYNKYIKFLNPALFKLLGPEKSLRPFELATIRLLNMFEILPNWNEYVPYPEYLTQRGGSFILGNDNEILYSFRAKSLLGYSPDMSRPLGFIDNELNL